LVCFPHSGGGPSAFAAWPEMLDEFKIEVVAISTPGHERRIDAKPIQDWKVLVAEITEALSESGIVDDVPYALFGHSFGAVLACEVARRLDATMIPQRPRPIHVFASAHAGPAQAAAHRDDGSGTMHTMDVPDLVKAVERFGFLPAEVLSNEGLLKAVIPGLRADFQMYETYVPDADRKKLPCSITAMGGKEDKVGDAALQCWAEETTQALLGPVLLPGAHFYLMNSFVKTLRLLLEHIERSLELLPRSIVKSAVKIPDYIYTKPSQEVIRMRMEENPDMLAFVDERGSVTYREFMRRVDLLAMDMHQRFLKGERQKVVALLTPHDITYVTGFVAIFRSCSIFLCIEAHFPPDMAREISQENSTCLVLSSPEHTFKFSEWCSVIELGPDWVGELDRRNPHFDNIPEAKTDDICILMMTSGTTGRPKTIAGTHFFLTLGLHAKTLSHPFEGDCRMACNVMFIWEVLQPAMYGSKTCYILPDSATLDPNVFVSFLEKFAITHVLTTPSLMNTILQYCASGLARRLSKMKHWWTCGEVLSMKSVYKFRESVPHIRLLNDYSTWESGDIAYAIIDPDRQYTPNKTFPTAGYAAPGAITCIIDPETKKVVPRGMCGELYVGGPGISNGYFKAPDITAEKFVRGFNTEMQAAWDGAFYKTGDLCRFVGEPPVLEIRGRIDSTVKIRGFKVGIPVVEAAIQEVVGVAICGIVPIYSAPGIVECLCAFVGPHDGVDFKALIQKIKVEGPKKIPRWMMPTFIKPMPSDALSGGESRKLDRRKLAESVSFESLQADATKAAQETVVEDEATVTTTVESEGGVRGIVRATWAKSLNLNANNLDLEENFFDLGGHSTLAARMASELSGDYGLNITVLDIYSNSTLGALLEFIDPQGVVAHSDIRQVRSPPKVGAQVPLAIVGLAGRFPGAGSAEAFWQNIKAGAVSATFLSPELLRKKGVPENVISNKDFVKCGYIMDEVDKFDHVFFGIGKAEASLMDPQHRVFIETSWAALENAALPPRGGLSNDVVGVFAAAGIDGYLIHHLDGAPLKDSLDPESIFFAEIGNEKDYIATRVAYLMDFTGPAMNVNSACSSALVACSQAGTAIAFGQCDAAVAGASSVTFPNLGYLYQEGLVASIDGYVRPFDKGADGTVFGDAVGAVVVRRADDVKKTNALSWASLLGFSTTNDGGQKAGYAAPSSVGQSHAIMNALRLNSTDPWSLSYVECHATGTRIGDGIEVRGLIDAFTQVGGKKKIGEAVVSLGSVKGNIAHANCAAGITGLIKVLSMLRSRQLAPVANFKTLNPKVNLTGTPFQVHSELSSWDFSGRPLRAGVSSFGIGGTNAHCVLEEAPASAAPSAPAAKWSFQVLPFSAKSPESLADNLKGLATDIRSSVGNGVDLPATAWTLQTGRAALPLRKAVIVPCAGSDLPVVEQSAALAKLVEANVPSEEDLDEIEEAVKRPAVAFLFPGQGSQYLRMGRNLYDEVPLYKEAVDQCCERLLAPDLLGRDLRPILFSSDRDKEFAEPSILQPSMFVTEYAMAQMLQAVGVVPAVVGGHSLGEYVAATVSGLLTLEDALKIVAARSKATETLARDGAMLAVSEWSDEELRAIKAGSRKNLWLAAINSPVHAVISGETSAVEELEAELKAAGRRCTRLVIRKAFHSGLVQEAADTLKGLGVPAENSASAVCPVTSNFTGGWLNAESLRDGTYWTNHMRNGVMWRENAEKLLNQWQPAIVLEVGPGNALSTLTKKCIPKGTTSPLFLQAMRHPKSVGVHDVEAFLGMLGQLWEAGCDIKWQALHTNVLGSTTAAIPSLLRLPPYSFKRTSLWEKPERSVYVKGDVQTGAVINTLVPGDMPLAHSAALVRYGDQLSKEPSLRAYCLAFAGGSSTHFVPWTDQTHEAIEIIAVEMPGRGGRSDDKLPASDADDMVLIDELCKAIMADVKGVAYVLVGFSMGGNLSVEIALRLATMKAQMPLALYVAGRKPPAADPSAIGTINMSDEALASYAMASPEVVRSAEFREHALPKLRADLELDLRVEKRLSALHLKGQRLSATVAFEVFCGTDDQVAPWAAAQDWQRFVQTPIGMHFMPGGHEFLIEMRPMILRAWQQNAIGRFVQKQIAGLAALGFAPGATTPVVRETVVAGPISPKQELPFYAVRWVPPVVDELVQLSTNRSSPYFLFLLNEVSSDICDEAAAALKAGSKVVVVCNSRGQEDSTLQHGILEKDALDYEVNQCWRFIHLVQRLLEAGAAGSIVLVCPSAAVGAMVAGASKAVALEASELIIQRVFLPWSICAHQGAAKAVEVAERHSKEGDLWVQHEATLDMPGSAWPVVVQRLEHTLEPSVKVPCVPKRGLNGELAVYVLTGATGGLGSAVIEWLVTKQQLSVEQLVLLRRSGSAPLTGILAQCRVLEVASPDNYDALVSCGLKDIGDVTGVFHLAGVLDDGIIGSMTQERVSKVAQPKCGIVVSLLRAAIAFKWPLKWLVGFSSTSSLFGYGGQVNYSAANGLLDQMAVFGLGSDSLKCPIITINWGPWGEAGMAKVGTKAYELAVREGDTPLKTDVALRCLAAALRSGSRAGQAATQFCACDVDWQRSQWKDLPILDLVVERELWHEDKPLAASADAPGSKTSRASIEDFMADHTSQAWGRIKGKSLVKLGLDSLEMVGLRNAFNKHFGVNVPLRIVAEPSQKVSDLVEAIESFINA